MKQVCHVCANKIKSKEDVVAACPHCGTDLLNPTLEYQQIAPVRCTFSPKFSALSALQGTALLTNRRVVWFDQSSAATAGAAFGLVGALIATAASGNKKIFAIPVETIVSAEVEKKALTKYLVITTTDGKKYAFIAKKPDNWVQAIMANVHYFRQYGQCPAQA